MYSGDFLGLRIMHQRFYFFVTNYFHFSLLDFINTRILVSDQEFINYTDSNMYK